MFLAELTMMDNKFTHKQQCIYTHYNQTFRLIAILINILSEQNQRAALAPELCSAFPGGVGTFLWQGQDLSPFPPPGCSFSSEGNKAQAGSKSRNPFFPATANRNSGTAHPSLERMALLVKPGLSTPLSLFFFPFTLIKLFKKAVRIRNGSKIMAILLFVP